MKRYSTAIFAFLCLSMSQSSSAGWLTESLNPTPEQRKKHAVMQEIARLSNNPQSFTVSFVARLACVGSAKKEKNWTGQSVYHIKIQEELTEQEARAITAHEVGHVQANDLEKSANAHAHNTDHPSQKKLEHGRQKERRCDLFGSLNQDGTFNESNIEGFISVFSRLAQKNKRPLDTNNPHEVYKRQHTSDHPCDEARVAYFKDLQDMHARGDKITEAEKIRFIACGKEKVGEECEQAQQAWLEMQRTLKRA